jgi:hypothetical protein
MREHETSAELGMPWYRKVALVILFPFILPIVPLVIAILLVLVVYAEIHIFVSEIRFRRRMRQCGRFLRRRQLNARIAEEGSGTLIIESPSLGWGFTHAWWTPDTVLAVSPYAAPTDDEYRSATKRMRCLDWDRWHWENYTDPDKGRGHLLRVWNGRSLEKWVRRNHPLVDVVHTWTALVHAPKPTTEPGGT